MKAQETKPPLVYMDHALKRWIAIDFPMDYGIQCDADENKSTNSTNGRLSRLECIDHKGLQPSKRRTMTKFIFNDQTCLSIRTPIGMNGYRFARMRTPSPFPTDHQRLLRRKARAVVRDPSDIGRGPRDSKGTSERPLFETF